MLMRRLISGVFMAVFLSGSLLAQDLQTAAREAVENERYEEARDLYLQISEQNPWNIGHTRRVVLLCQHGRSRS